MVAYTVSGPGNLRTGDVPSPTATVNFAAGATLPWLSVAVQLTTVLPTGNRDPLG